MPMPDMIQHHNPTSTTNKSMVITDVIYDYLSPWGRIMRRMSRPKKMITTRSDTLTRSRLFPHALADDTVAQHNKHQPQHKFNHDRGIRTISRLEQTVVGYR